MAKTTVVTGAGSGVGQAIALALVKQGWRAAIVGRRAETLEETVKLAGPLGEQLFVCPCDIGNVKAVKKASPKAGPAYVMSKFGLAGLTQSINSEERSNGVRACAIFPGDIDTPLLDRRPAPPSAEARARMLQPDDVSACALLAISLP